MFSRSLFPLFALGAVFATGAAQAQTPMAAPGDWWGPYVGAEIGYGFDGGNRETELSGGTFDGFSRNYGLNGVIGGGFAGYNLQSGPFVAGVEGDFQGSDIHGGWSSTGSGSYQQNLPWVASLHPRLGWVWGDRLLLYGTAGFAFGDIQETDRYLGGFSFNRDQVRWGYTVGGGAEYKLWGPWNARVEYRWTSFTTNTDNVPKSTISEETSTRFNQIEGGLSYHF
jgi:outer membrane immunogenic protein